jgi:EAL domain-containing protein (putative c-di-GMP-specific phosphodiesterase class I)
VHAPTCRRGIDHAAGVRVWINLAAEQLMSPHLVEEITAALARHHLPPERLGVEVTETAVVGDIDQARDVLGDVSARRPAWPSTTSAPACRRSPTSAGCPSTW